MIKYILFFMLICGVCWGCQDCIERPDEKEMRSVEWQTGKMQDGWTEQHIILLRRMNELNKRLDKIDGTIEKIFSMVVDLEEKFMGIDRMEQIAMPAIHERKLANKMKREPNWNGKGKL